MPSFSRLTGFAWSSRTALAVGGLPSIGLTFKGGLGDDVMCTAVARALAARGAGKIWQFTRFPEIFTGNPDVIAVADDFRLIRLCAMFGVPCLELEYPDPPSRHLIATIAAAAGVTGEIELCPRLYLTDTEKRAGRAGSRPQIAIQTSSLGAKYPMRNKQWPPERFQTVADALAGDFDLVQLGSAGDPGLDGTTDLRGRTTVRETASVLAASHLFIGLVGGLMHLARAVDCRSVIVYGGREHPSQSGYAANENLYWDGACAPCWQRSDCDFDRTCLQEIRPDAVVAAARRQALRHGSPIEIDRAVI
jgi:hypothetical protein